MLSDTNYVLCHQIKPVTLLDRQFGRRPKLFAPHKIFKLLWPHLDIPANICELKWESWPQPVFPAPEFDEKTHEKDTALFGEPLPELKCYMILDAKKHPFFDPRKFMCRIENLFQGEFAQETKDVAPYLVEVIPYPEYRLESELMGLFSEENSFADYNWHEQLGIFIHSRYDFDTVLHHFRRFPLMKDENDKWFFFRFYDPKVLRDYLEVISHSPEKLSKFFGYDKRIVHAFGSGIDDSFNYYQLKALPEETVPAQVMLAKWEVDGLKEQRWRAEKDKAINHLLQHYPHLVSEQDKSDLSQALDEASQTGYTDIDSLMQYAMAKQIARKNGQDFYAQKNHLLEHHGLTETALLLWREFLKDTDYE